MRGELVHGCEYRPSLKIDEENVQACCGAKEWLAYAHFRLLSLLLCYLVTMDTC